MGPTGPQGPQGVTGPAGAGIQSDWRQDDPTAGDYIKNKPSFKPGNNTEVVDNGRDIRINTTSYTHSQDSPSDKWVIQHNLNKYPSVAIVDSAGSIVFGEVKYDSPNQLTISFVAPFCGKAHLN
jgi:hypothetical protein